MRFTDKGFLKNVDWWLVLSYIVLIFIGWINIYASVHSSQSGGILDMGGRSGMQFVWMCGGLVIAVLVLFVLNPHLYESLSLPIYLLTLLLLISVIFLGTEVKGSRSWFDLGGFRFQPAEISKIATSLLLARIMSQFSYNIGRFRDFIVTAIVIIAPMFIIIAQSETGSALVYVGFVFVLYREGLSGWLIFIIGMAILLFILTLTASPYTAVLVCAAAGTLCTAAYNGEMKRWLKFYLPGLTLLAFVPMLLRSLTGLSDSPEAFIHSIKPLHLFVCAAVPAIFFMTYRAFRLGRPFTYLAVLSFIAGVILVFSTDFLFNEVLQDHQRSRIEVLLGMKEDPSGVGYNVNQSMIAIGSGGLFGKGYLQGTQTTFGFVPEQTTDFIFCTIGEEWGFAGTLSVILLYVFLIWRIMYNAERCKEAFTRIYGYCVASCIFMHLIINIGMTIGLMPVIGIPLPFISYGGSSMLAFSTLLFIFIVLAGNEKHNLRG